MEYRIMGNSLLLQLTKTHFSYNLHSKLNLIFTIQDTNITKIHQEILLKEVTLAPINLIRVPLDMLNHLLLLSRFFSLYLSTFLLCCIGVSISASYWACWCFRYVMFFIKPGKFSTIMASNITFLSLLSFWCPHYQSLLKGAWWCPTGLSGSYFSSFFFVG